MSAKFKIVPFKATIKSGSNAKKIAAQFKTIVDSYTSQGWNYAYTTKVNVEVSSGCLGIFAGNSYTTYNLIIFSSKVPFSQNALEEEISNLVEVSPLIAQKRQSGLSEENTIQSRKNLENKKKVLSEMSIFFLVLAVLAVAFLIAMLKPNKAEEKSLTFSELMVLFEEQYRSKNYEVADQTLKQIESVSPGSNYATSARNALNKKLTKIENDKREKEQQKDKELESANLKKQGKRPSNYTLNFCGIN